MASDKSHELQLRSDPDRRRQLGSWFTDADVALHIARATIASAFCELAAEPEIAQQCQLIPADALSHVQALTHQQRPGDLSSVIGSLHVVDPCCGAGAFLAAAWQVLGEIAQITGGTCHASQLHGIDIDPDAAAHALDEITALAGPGAEIVCADATHTLLDHLPLLKAHGGADACVGNPPWVGGSKSSRTDLATASCPNVYAWIVEQSTLCLKESGWMGQVIPISSMTTSAFSPLRSMLSSECDVIYTSHFDTVPSSLFTGVVQRLSIIQARRGSGEARWFTTTYHRHLKADRARMLAGVTHHPLPPHSVDGSIAKISANVEDSILAKIFAHAPLQNLLADTGANPVLYKRRWSYFLLFLDHEPLIYNEDMSPRSASECKELHAGPELTQHALIALLSSTTFWWYFSVFTDNRNVNRRDINAFGFNAPSPALVADLDRLGRELMRATQAASELRKCTYKSVGTIYNTYYLQGATRPVLDRIDALLATHWGLTEDELGFILDFERSYRS